MGLGGTDDSQQRLQLAENEETKALIARQTARALRDVKKLFGSAEQNLLGGAQGSLDVQRQYVPQQFGALQQGNLAAQEQLIAGMPQVQNALLGLPTDLSGFQPRTFQPDLSFLNQQIPQYQTASQALALTPEERAQETTFGAEEELEALPRFTKSDFKVGGVDSMSTKINELQSALSGMSPEAYDLLAQEGPSTLGLGGRRGTALFNKAIGSGYDTRGQALGMGMTPEQIKAASDRAFRRF